MNGDNDIQTTYIFQRNPHTNLNTFLTMTQLKEQCARGSDSNHKNFTPPFHKSLETCGVKILVVAVGTTRTLLFQPCHRQESVPP
jgi:hypothetical protein